MAASDDTDEMWLANLHDVFLNASYMRTLMQAEPLPAAADEWTMSSRGRLERFWHRDLCALVEAWERMTKPRHSRLREWAPEAYDELAALLTTPEMRECIGPLHPTRDYMSHRDRRQYWDAGRVAAALAGVEQPRGLNVAYGSTCCWRCDATHLASAEDRRGRPCGRGDVRAVVAEGRCVMRFRLFRPGTPDGYSSASGSLGSASSHCRSRRGSIGSSPIRGPNVS